MSLFRLANLLPDDLPPEVNATLVQAARAALAAGVTLDIRAWGEFSPAEQGAWIAARASLAQPGPTQPEAAAPAAEETARSIMRDVARSVARGEG